MLAESLARFFEPPDVTSWKASLVQEQCCGNFFRCNPETVEAAVELKGSLLTVQLSPRDHRETQGPKLVYDASAKTCLVPARDDWLSRGAVWRKLAVIVQGITESSRKIRATVSWSRSSLAPADAAAPQKWPLMAGPSTRVSGVFYVLEKRRLPITQARRRGRRSDAAVEEQAAEEKDYAKTKLFVAPPDMFADVRAALRFGPAMHVTPTNVSLTWAASGDDVVRFRPKEPAAQSSAGQASVDRPIEWLMEGDDGEVTVSADHDVAEFLRRLQSVRTELRGACLRLVVGATVLPAYEHVVAACFPKLPQDGILRLQLMRSQTTP